METYIALLRGINVGKANRIAMEDLRALLSGLGYTHIHTLLNSGNVVFQAKGAKASTLGAQIMSAIATQLALDVLVIVKTSAEFDSAISENPLASRAVDPTRLLVAFAQDNPSLRVLAKIRALLVTSESFEVGANAAYLDCADGIHTSKAALALLGKLGKSCTTRNWATVLKLQELESAVSVKIK
jgi:uncharacterized protein (DUF1697 family)